MSGGHPTVMSCSCWFSTFDKHLSCMRGTQSRRQLLWTLSIVPFPMFFFAMLHCRLSFKLARLCNLPKGDGIKLVIPDSCRSGHVYFVTMSLGEADWLARTLSQASGQLATTKKKKRRLMLNAMHTACCFSSIFRVRTTH